MRVFTQLASTHARLLERKVKKVIAKQKNSITTELVWNSIMSAILLFWNTNMADLTSCENTP